MPQELPPVRDEAARAEAHDRIARPLRLILTDEETVGSALADISRITGTPLEELEARRSHIAARVRVQRAMNSRRRLGLS